MPEISVLADPKSYDTYQTMLESFIDQLSKVDFEAIEYELHQEFPEEDAEGQLFDVSQNVETLHDNLETLHSTLAVCHAIHHRHALAFVPPTNSEGIIDRQAIVTPAERKPFNSLIHIPRDPESRKQGRLGLIAPSVFVFDSEENLPQVPMLLEDMLQHQIGDIADLNRNSFNDLIGNIGDACEDLSPYLEAQDIDFAPLLDMLSQKAFSMESPELAQNWN